MDAIKKEYVKEPTIEKQSTINWSLLLVEIISMTAILGPFIIMAIDLFSKNK